MFNWKKNKFIFVFQYFSWLFSKFSAVPPPFANHIHFPVTSIFSARKFLHTKTNQFQNIILQRRFSLYMEQF